MRAEDIEVSLRWRGRRRLALMIRARDPRSQRYIHDHDFRPKADVYVFLCSDTVARCPGLTKRGSATSIRDRFAAGTDLRSKMGRELSWRFRSRGVT